MDLNQRYKNPVQIILKDEEPEVYIPDNSSESSDDIYDEYKRREHLRKQRLRETINGTELTDFKNYEKELKERYPELEEYIMITHDNLYKMRKGGIVKYLGFGGEMRYGGILVKIQNQDKPNLCKLTLKTNFRIWSLKYKNYLVFYKDSHTRNDRFRQLFITLSELTEVEFDQMQKDIKEKRKK